MKKYVCAVLCVLLILCVFTGCGKSEAVKATEKLIGDIGKISLESEEPLSLAREAFDALTEEEQAKVKNLSKLEKAEAEYKEITDFNADIEAIIRSAEASFSAEDFDLSGLIEKADAIEEQYAAMSEERKAMVTDYEKVADAKAVLVSYIENAQMAAAQYIKAFQSVYKTEKYTVTGVYCIKQIRNETDEYHLFALTYNTADGKEKNAYSHARCTTDVTAEAIAARPETFFAEKPVTDDSDAIECGNVKLDIESALALIGG